MPNARRRTRGTASRRRLTKFSIPIEAAGSHPASSPRVETSSVVLVPIPDTDLHRVRTWAEHHTPPEIRSRLWVELDITTTAVTVYECRPSWQPDQNPAPMRDPVARCRWNNTTKRWTLYWQRRDLKFHIWPHLDPQPTITPLLAEIDDHSNGAFCG
jgi:hypothetical protein